MQGNQHNIFSMRDKIRGDENEISYMDSKNRIEKFPNYSQMITDNCEFDKDHTNYLMN